MTDFVVLGTDTDAGKTTFALLWLAFFGEEFAYWKPLETGDADSDKIRRLSPNAQVFPSLLRFAEPVAPLCAARLHGASIPSAQVIASQTPRASKALVVETFGSPFSPINEQELQVALVEALALPTVLVSSSAIGAIGRTLQCLLALERFDVQARAVVLVGERDESVA